MATPSSGAGCDAPATTSTAPKPRCGQRAIPNQPIGRASRNDIEKRSRQKRQQRVQAMHVRVQTLEMVLSCLRTESSAGDGSEFNSLVTMMDEFFDPDTNRLANFLRESRTLVQVAAQLESERKELLDLLQQKKEVEFNLLRAVASRWAEWDCGGGELKSVTSYATYEPWRPEDVDAVIQDALLRIKCFAMSTDCVSSGLDFMGWSDIRRLDMETMQLQFSFSKSFVNTNASRLFEMFWEMQFSDEKLRRYNLGYSTKLKVSVLQQISDDEVIVKREAQYPGVTTKFHTVLLIFRRQIRNGFMACMRTLPALSIQSTIDGDDAWMNQFHWTRIESVPDADGNLTGCRLTFSGSISSEDAQYARHWMMEIATVLVRGENTMIAPRQIGG